MEGETLQLYPTALETFQQIRQEGYIYIDKTNLIYNMTHGEAKYIFSSRPRRFGKSLLVSTLKAYYEGKKDSFKGLAIENLEKDWIEYPMLHFDLSTAKDLEKREDILSDLNLKLQDFENIYGRNEAEKTFFHLFPKKYNTHFKK